MNIEKIQSGLLQFINDRNWNKYHNPKNLSQALAGEVGELNDVFQWLSCEESKKENINDITLQAAKEEIADILIYSFRFCYELDIDIEEAIEEKIEKNALKYPLGDSSLD